jgi:hypothetical protein
MLEFVGAAQIILRIFPLEAIREKLSIGNLMTLDTADLIAESICTVTETGKVYWIRLLPPVPLP